MEYHLSYNLDFKRNPYPGKFIVIEGIDGGGKTTQAKAVVEILNKKGEKTIFTEEPTGGPIGQLIRKVLRGTTEIPPASFQYLFAADRQMHQEEIIKYLTLGTTVVSDRYFWSSVAYGMADRESLTGDILLVAQSILSLYHQFILPDLTFYLDVQVETAMKRLKSMHKEKELYERLGKLEKIARGYEWLAKKFPKEITVIDGEKPVVKVTEEILKLLK